ncbi:hypothetical protein [Orrella marina]|uniref:hypothetical protein n=1 Tax=Orrella marina TaxID=2163011 RepID=UPI001D131F84|nr:hypothetical protein [Orrella marina]
MSVRVDEPRDDGLALTVNGLTDVVHRGIDRWHVDNLSVVHQDLNVITQCQLKAIEHPQVG